MSNGQSNQLHRALRESAIEILGSEEEADAILPGVIERLKLRAANANQQCKGPCKRILPLSSFSIDYKTSNGLNQWCHECEAEFRKEKSRVKRLKKEAKIRSQQDTNQKNF